MLWLFWENPALAGRDKELEWTRDLWRDKGMRFLHWLFLPMNILCGVLLFVIGWAVDGAAFGWSLFIWGFCLRTVFVWHGTWFVNSVTHVWGYRNYKTTDNSRNTWWVALLTFGEGWHNNHHADQRAAAHGHRWWEFDITYYTIKIMSWCGLAWDVVKPRYKDRIVRPPMRSTA
jgi:stearoyl-CoA desaturase (delta-9 desaturase)